MPSIAMPPVLAPSRRVPDREAKPHALPSPHWHHLPSANDPAFLEAVRHLCHRLEADLLIPGVDEELVALSVGREAIGCQVLLPPADFVRTHLDKLTSFERLHALGLPAPATTTLADRQRPSFPCIVKPRRGRGSRDVAIPRSEEELRAHLLHCRRPAEDFIAQKLLHGQEYTVMMVADSTCRLRAVVPVKVHLKRGITLRAETDRDEQVQAACAAIHAADPVSGCFNIQVVKAETGEVRPFEINPRISTTACLAAGAGVDFSALSLDRPPVDASPLGLAPFQDRYGLKRSWHNEFLPSPAASLRPS